MWSRLRQLFRVYPWIKLIAMFAISILVGFATSDFIDLSEGLLTTMYAVLGITFSLSMSQATGLDYSQVKNKRLRDRLMGNARKQTRMLIQLFFITTALLIISFILNCDIINSHFNIGYCTLTMIVMALLYTSFSFQAITDLRHELADSIADGK